MFLDMSTQHNISPIVPTNIQEIHSDADKVDEFITAIDQHLQNNQLMENYKQILKIMDTDKKPWELATIIDN